MAHTRSDTWTKTVQWWKHLRPFWKRKQTKKERRAARIRAAQDRNNAFDD